MLDYVQQLPYLDEEFMQRFRSDFRWRNCQPSRPRELTWPKMGEYYEFYNKWGTKLRMPKEGGSYFDYVDFPIKEPTEEALEPIYSGLTPIPGVLSPVGEPGPLSLRKHGLRGGWVASSSEEESLNSLPG